MSGIELRALLADATQGGAYFVDARDREALIEAANSLTYAVIPIDFGGFIGKDAALDTIASALHFPDWFGGNSDALADCLRDLSWRPATGYLLLLERIEPWRAADPEGFGTLLDIFNEAAASWARAGTAFWALAPLPAATLAAMEA